MKIDLFLILELENVSAQFEVVDKVSMHLGGAIVRKKHYGVFLELYLSHQMTRNSIFLYLTTFNYNPISPSTFCGTRYWHPMPGHTIDSNGNGVDQPCRVYLIVACDYSGQKLVNNWYPWPSVGSSQHTKLSFGEACSYSANT